MAGDSTSRAAPADKQGRKLSNVTLFTVFKTENSPAAPLVKEWFTYAM